MSDPIFAVPGPDLTARQLHDLLKLRVEIFVVEQECPYPEIDGFDLEPDTTHLWLADADGPTSSIRILADPVGYRIGRVVTRFDSRGQGLSGHLIERGLELIGEHDTVLGAQAHLRAFYERFGYSVSGPGYDEDGIPHVPMFRAGRPLSAEASTGPIADRGVG